MVLERLVSEKIIERKLIYAFLLGVIYSIVGIVLAAILFPADPSLVAVAFTSILLIPSIRKIFSIEERQAKEVKKFSFKRLWHCQNDFIRVYLLILLGIFLVYAVSALILPSFQVNSLFRDQLVLRGAGAVDGPASGRAFAFSSNLFLALLINNFIVLIACVIMSFLTGDGAIFLLTWNASLWGSIFGVTARNASFVSSMSPLVLLGLILLIVLPHAFLEMMSYILGAISGGMMSSDIELDEDEKREDRFKKFYWKFILWILVFALIFLLIGSIVETFVLNNVSIYQTIIEQSFIIR
jgi:uncharacterized membrane protein SpoIIM required for sporulation